MLILWLLQELCQVLASMGGFIDIITCRQI
jgi:hypothetical protein